MCNQTCFSVDTSTFLYMVMMMMMMTMMTNIIPYWRTKTHIWEKVLMGIWASAIIIIISIIIIIIIIITSVAMIFDNHHQGVRDCWWPWRKKDALEQSTSYLYPSLSSSSSYLLLLCHHRHQSQPSSQICFSGSPGAQSCRNAGLQKLSGIYLEGDWIKIAKGTTHSRHWVLWRTQSSPVGLRRSFYKLWTLGQTSSWFCLAKGEKYM